MMLNGLHGSVLLSEHVDVSEERPGSASFRAGHNKDRSEAVLTQINMFSVSAEVICCEHVSVLSRNRRLCIFEMPQKEKTNELQRV